MFSSASRRLRVAAQRAAAAAQRHMSVEAEAAAPETPPRDVLGLAVFTVPVLVTAGLGLWQWRRKTWKEEQIALRKERLKLPPVPAPGEYLDESGREALQHRQVAVTGEYDHSKTMLVGPRTYDGQAGFHMIVPMKCTNGTIVLVNRGWVPKQVAGDPAAMASFKTKGVVATSGVSVIPMLPSSFVPPNAPAEGKWYALRLEEMAAWAGAPSVPLLLETIQTAPSSLPANRRELPIPRDPAEIVSTYVMPEGHRAYAATWWTLSAALAGLTYVRFFKSRRPRIRPPPA
eukprot:tig00000711_g3393.t1